MDADVFVSRVLVKMMRKKIVILHFSTAGFFAWPQKVIHIR